MPRLSASDPDIGHHRAARVVGLVYGSVLGILFGIPLSALLGFEGWMFIGFALAFAVVAAFAINRMMTHIPEAMASFIARMVYPSGSTTPYAKVYSREQSIAASGNVEGALEAYADAMRLNPDDPEPRFQAAELAFRSTNPARAEALFKEGRRLAGEERARELYATQRLIDLYLGPMNDDKRALVELRRLVDRFPGTREGKAAEEVLRKLKSEQR